MDGLELLQAVERLESEVRGYVRAFPTVFQSAEGSWITDATGRRFLDFFAGAGTLNYGHNNRLAKQALLNYIQRDGIQHGLDMATSAKIDFLQTFERVILRPRGLDYKVQFCGPTGTNAVEAAIKLARKRTGRSHVVAFTRAYHGHSLGSLAVTANQYYHDEHYGSHSNVSHVPFEGYLGSVDTSAYLDKVLSDSASGLPKPAAVILETVQGEGGIHVASNGWLQRVAEICRQHEVLLIIDDIQVGNGRTGTFFSFEPSGIRPDMVCLSKAIGGGLPMSLVLMDRQHDVWKPGQHTGTFRGNNLAFVAARALLEYWETEAFAKRVIQHGQVIGTKLLEIAESCPGRRFSVRGRGMVWGLDVGSGELAGRISRLAFARGLIIETAGAQDDVVKLLPPLTTDLADLEYGLTILAQAVREADTESSRSVVPLLTTSLPAVVPSHVS